MKGILVFDKGLLLGTFTVPQSDNDEIICLYKKWTFKVGTINILYFRDMGYGIVISDDEADYFDELEESLQNK